MTSSGSSQPKAHYPALLNASSRGEEGALDALLPAVYGELHRQAEAPYMRRQPPGHILQATALVHEAYLRLVDQRDIEWRSRAHFFGIAAKTMRSILVDYARARRAAKRGSGAAHLTLGDADITERQGEVDMLDLDEALRRLSELDPEKGQLVELRYFGGLSIEETAEVLEVSPATLKRRWNTARAWLRRELSPPTEYGEAWSAERWRRIEALFEAARERPVAEQAAFLDQACGEDAEWRQEVESLLGPRPTPGSWSPPLPLTLQHRPGRRGPVPTCSTGSSGRSARPTGSRWSGGGGMARIFVATDTALGRRVVIKVLATRRSPPASTPSGSIGKSASPPACSIPHVVPLHAAGQGEGLLYYTMPFVAGESLRQRLDREGPLPVD